MCACIIMCVFVHMVVVVSPVVLSYVHTYIPPLKIMLRFSQDCTKH